MHRTHVTTGLALLLLSFAPGAPARAAILRVKADAPGPVHDGTTWVTAHATIQAALEGAQPGDEVWVAHTYSYHERIRITKAGIGLYGGFRGSETAREQRVLDSPTYLNGDDLDGPVVEVAGGRGAVIDGFRIYRDRASSHAGVYVLDQGVTISHNTISGHGAVLGNNRVEPTTGGGIAIHTSNATITDNIVTGNFASRGAGIFVGGRNALIARNVITDNVAGGPNEFFAEGGGLCIWGGGEPVVVRDNVIARNIAMAYSTYPDSTGGAGGGGIAMTYANAIILNNTIVHNVASGTSSTRGAGIFTRKSAFTLSNNILAFNRAEPLWGVGTAAGGGIGYEAKSGYESQVTARFNLFHGNTPDEGLPAGEEGTLRADPVLAGPRDYRLTADSLAIDAGLNAAATPGGGDVEGLSRVVGVAVDMGAYEYPVRRTPGTLTRAYVRADGDDTRSGASWAEARRSIGSAVSLLKMGGEVWIAAGTYTDRLQLNNGLSLYGGFAGTETDRDARDIGGIRANATVLDGLSRGTVLTIQGSGVTVDGLTIRRGSGSGSPGYKYGGGIICSFGDVTIARCIIEDNEVVASEDNPSGAGGALLQHGGSLTLANNIIRRNRLTVVQQMGFPQFANAAFGSGGAVALSTCNATVVNNLFTDNVLSVGGFLSQYFVDGAALSLSGVNGVVANNTFADNREEIMYYPEDYGAGTISISGGAAVANNIIACNSSGVVGTLTNFRHNNVVFNGDFEDGASADAQDNIHRNPRFTDRAAQNFRQMETSPVIDAGLDSAAPVWPDLDGHPRIQGAHVDMGAYESAGVPSITLGDVASVLRVAAGLTLATSETLAHDADANGIDIDDAVRLARKAAGLDANP